MKRFKTAKSVLYTLSSDSSCFMNNHTATCQGAKALRGYQRVAGIKSDASDPLIHLYEGEDLLDSEFERNAGVPMTP